MKDSSNQPEIIRVQEQRPYVLWQVISKRSQGRSEMSVDAQRVIAETFMGKEAVGIYTDELFDDSPINCQGLQEAIALCKRQNYALVIVKSEFCRNASEALEILELVGENNLYFCDLPICNRYVLSTLWAILERQSIIRSISTRVALENRKKSIENDGGYISKRGVYRTTLGNKKGADLTTARSVAIKKRRDAAKAWREESGLYQWVKEQLGLNRSYQEILKEALTLYEKDSVQYGTRTGKPLSAPLLSLWKDEILSIKKDESKKSERVSDVQNEVEQFASIVSSKQNQQYSIPFPEDNDSIQSVVVDGNSRIAEKKTDRVKERQTDSKERLDRIEKIISRWVERKGYHRRLLTIKLCAEMLGLSEVDLRFYLDRGLKQSFQSWLSYLRVEESKELLLINGGNLDETIVYSLGFEGADSFDNEFRSIEGLYPYPWIKAKVARLQSGEEKLPVKQQDALHKATIAFERWKRTKNYCNPNLDIVSVAKEIGVTTEALKLYCTVTAQESFDSIINRLRVAEARRILVEHPEINLQHVCSKVGIPTVALFIDLYSRITGMSPETSLGESSRSTSYEINQDRAGENRVFSFDEEPIVQWIKKKGYCVPNLSQAEVARRLGFSENRFSQYLKQVPKATFSRWISDLRMEEAKRLLIEKPSLSIQEVSERVGISQKANFRTQFKEYTGSTPDSWRTETLTSSASHSKGGDKGGAEIAESVVQSIEKWVQSKGYCVPNITQKLASHLIGITEDQLTYYCLKKKQTRFLQWVIGLRIEEAKRLLVENQLTDVMEIARQVGFTDIKSFREIFKRVTGVLPTEWRKEHKWWDEPKDSSDKENGAFTKLNDSRLRQVESKTSMAQEILSDIFEEEDTVNQEGDDKKKESEIRAILSRILEKEEWPKKEFAELCSQYGLLAGYVIERINDIAFEKVGDILIDEDGDILSVELDYKNNLL